MRPPELEVTFVLHVLHCHVTEDAGGDEPYLWNLGFKVDADTLGPPPQGSLIPSLNVQIIEGKPFFAHVVGSGSMSAGQSAAIHPWLGTRTMRLKPALIPLAGWFPGLCGIICLLWDEDGFAPSTAEAGLKRLKTVLGPALTTELNALAAGAYDDALARDANGVLLPDGPEGRTLQWRLARLGDQAGRDNAVRALTSRVKDSIVGPVRDALREAAGLDELIDPDDLLGTQAKVFLGNELSASRPFSLTFTEDDAHYVADGMATGRRVYRTKLESTLTRAERKLDRVVGSWRRVCWGPNKLYWAFAYRNESTVRYELRPLLGPAPPTVRWFIDDRPIPTGQSNLAVTFQPAGAHFGAPQDVLAEHYPGGPGTIKCNANGPVLEVSHDGGGGVFFGTVRVLYAYEGDPTIFPKPEPPVAELIARGYDAEADLDIVGVQLEMNDEYLQDVIQCMRKVTEFDLKRVPVNWGKVKFEPGDPPEWRLALQEARDLTKFTAGASGLDLAASSSKVSPLMERRTLMPRESFSTTKGASTSE